MWDRRKLDQLAAQEAAALADPRWDRLYLAIERYDGTTHEKAADPADILRELDAAIDAVTYDEIKAQLTGTLVDSIFDRIRETKQRREQERKQEPQQDANQDEDAEPKM